MEQGDVQQAQEDFNDVVEFACKIVVFLVLNQGNESAVFACAENCKHHRDFVFPLLSM